MRRQLEGSPSGLKAQAMVDKLHRARVWMGISRNAMAKRMQLKTASLRNWEVGRTMPSLAHYLAWRDVIDGLLAERQERKAA